MPLSINVGLSRKASRDYQSSGTSINVTAELDQSLLARPEELQQQIRGLYEQAENALDHQASRTAVGADDPPARSDRRPNGNGSRNGGHGRPNGSAMTDSQRRCIESIAKRIGIDPRLESRDIIGVELTDLSLKQASELIDHLKALSPVNGRNGGGR
jgi:hypothetical protein